MHRPAVGAVLLERGPEGRLCRSQQFHSRQGEDRGGGNGNLPMAPELDAGFGQKNGRAAEQENQTDGHDNKESGLVEKLESNRKLARLRPQAAAGGPARPSNAGPAPACGSGE